MTKENENIFLHIIKEDYKRKEKEQNDLKDFEKEAKSPILIEHMGKSAIEKLKELWEDSAVTVEGKSVQKAEKPMEKDQLQVKEEKDQVQVEVSTDKKNVLDSLASLQTEEQKLLEKKENLLGIEEALKSKLVEEINRKKTAIIALKSEISTLQNGCNQLEQIIKSSL